MTALPGVLRGFLSLHDGALGVAHTGLLGAANLPRAEGDLRTGSTRTTRWCSALQSSAAHLSYLESTSAPVFFKGGNFVVLIFPYKPKFILFLIKPFFFFFLFYF